MFTGLVLLKLIFGTRYPAERTVIAVLMPFILVCAWAIISSFLMPRFFESEIYVWPQKVASFFVLTPLAPNSGNYTQDMYLLAAAMLAILASVYLTKTGFDLRRLLDAYFVSGLIVVFISLWQFASNVVGIWFPSEFFLSNPGWSLLSDESIGSVIRINGPFAEPSALASYLCGSTGAAGWVVLNGHRGILPRVLLGSALFVVLLSTSTTGYATLGLMACLTALYAIFLGSPSLRKRTAIGFAAIFLLVLAGFVTIPATAPALASTINEIATATLNKQQSSSYTDRTSTDRDSLRAAEQSDGLGVGWGSNRSSSLIPGLLAAVGVYGVAGLLWFAVILIRHVGTAHRLAASAEPRLIMHGCAGGIISYLIAALISGPSITSPDFFLLLALLIATAARVRYEANVTRLNLRSFGSMAGASLPPFGSRRQA
jgi:hypothetical protein